MSCHIRGGGGVLAYCYLYRIKKCDAYHNASLGTHIGFRSAQFKNRPFLPYGLNGIIISNDCEFGENYTIYHQVSVAGGNGGAPKIGNNVLLGAGGKVIGPVMIGSNVKIGAGCIVAMDVPDNATVVMENQGSLLKAKGNRKCEFWCFQMKFGMTKLMVIM